MHESTPRGAMGVYVLVALMALGCFVAGWTLLVMERWLLAAVFFVLYLLWHVVLLVVRDLWGLFDKDVFGRVRDTTARR